MSEPDSTSLQGTFDRANAALQQGRFDAATELYRRVLALRPDFAEAYSNLGVALAAQGRLGEAAVQYRQALALKPDLADTWRNLGRIVLAQGDAAQALSAARRALDAAETVETRAFFVQCARSQTVLPAMADFPDLVARALSEGWARPSELSALAADLFKLGARGRAALAGQDSLPALAADPLLRALMESAPVRDAEIERLLTRARSTILDLAARTDAADDDVLRFACSLARQCFINEYVFARTNEEIAEVARLHTNVSAALTSGSRVAPLALAAIAAYEPLHALGSATALARQNWPAAVMALIAQQVSEPEREHQLHGSIAALTPIEDEMSRKVQQQYEDMPYPRWITAAPASRAVPIDWYLRNQFAAPFRNLGPREHLDVLIAGCGTGQHAIETAQRFAGARVLAIDLSRTSLAYALRKSRALGVANIDYAQADILKLGTLHRHFDLIEAAGVLHHLADPAQGWRVLLSLLRPGGFMLVALYSAAARADIPAARAFIAERGYGSSADDIRRCRQEILALPEDTPVCNVAKYSDFFSTSECRDLLFHVNEHDFTIPQIKAFLIDNGLTFIGFANPPLQHYRRRFPDDLAMNDLDRWDAIERENPLSFVGMYHFWLQKPAS